MDSIDTLDEGNIKVLDGYINGNQWINYYCDCKAELDGWVDFEKEIIPVIEYFGRLLSLKEMSKEDLIAGFREYRRYAGGIYELAESYRIDSFRAKKKTVLKELRSEFDDFIKALELYLYEFVFKKSNVKKIKQISEINADYVISFNYTLTEQLYEIDEENTHHIHGKIRKNLELEPNNMVLGIDESISMNLDYLYFVKYFKRIQKRTGIKYKRFVEKKVVTSFGPAKEAYELYVYGHSLDKTDGDVLKYLIGEISESGILRLKPKKVIFFYYDQEDYEQKIINLISIYGRDNVEKNIETGGFEFRKTESEIVE